MNNEQNKPDKQYVIIYKGSDIYSTNLLCTNYEEVYFSGDVFMDPNTLKNHYVCKEKDAEFLQQIATISTFKAEREKIFVLEIKDLNKIKEEVEEFLLLSEII